MDQDLVDTLELLRAIVTKLETERDEAWSEYRKQRVRYAEIRDECDALSLQLETEKSAHIKTITDLQECCNKCCNKCGEYPGEVCQNCIRLQSELDAARREIFLLRRETLAAENAKQANDIAMLKDDLADERVSNRSSRLDLAVAQQLVADFRVDFAVDNDLVDG